MKWIGQKPRLEDLNLPQQLLERFVGDAHVLDRIQDGDTIRESPLNLFKSLANCVLLLDCSELCRQEYSQVSYAFDARQDYRHYFHLSLLTWTSWPNTGWKVLRSLGVESHVISHL